MYSKWFPWGLCLVLFILCVSFTYERRQNRKTPPITVTQVATVSVTGVSISSKQPESVWILDQGDGQLDVFYMDKPEKQPDGEVTISGQFLRKHGSVRVYEHCHVGP